jgi:hypothetical protein
MSLHQVGGSVPVRALPAMLRVVSSWKALASPHLRARHCHPLRDHRPARQSSQHYKSSTDKTTADMLR